MEEWTGKARTAPVTIGGDASDRIVMRARTFIAKYRDDCGIVRKVATGCRDKTAARAVFAELERRAELVKAKVMTGSESRAADHQGTPLGEHFAAYDDHLRVHISPKTGFPATPAHRENRRIHLRVTQACRPRPCSA